MGGFYLPGLLLWASQFNLVLVGLALLLCLTGSYTVMIVLRRASMLRGVRRLFWFVALCLCFGVDVWATHFIAMLAFDPGLPVYYDVARTALSILAAMLGALPAFALLLWRPAVRFRMGLGRPAARGCHRGDAFYWHVGDGAVRQLHLQPGLSGNKPCLGHRYGVALHARHAAGP